MKMHTSHILQVMAAVFGLGQMAVASPPVGHDFDSDTFDDFPVSITGYDPLDPVNGAVRIWSGATNTIIDTIPSGEANTLFGWSLGSAGDINSDGFDDLVVGEPLWGSVHSLEGRIQVFSGQDGTLLLSSTGPYAETGFGRYVAGIGDWNGDGVNDIAVSGWDIADIDDDGIGDDPVGIVFVISGADGTVLTEIFEPTATSLFGYSIFGLGDITGDGLADLAVVDRGADGVPGAKGKLYIFAGQAQVGAISGADAHYIVLNDNPNLRGFASHVDTMHPDLWLDEPTLQIISLTAGGTGGPNQSETEIVIRKLNGQYIGTKGMRQSLVLAGDINFDGKVDSFDLQESIAQLGTNPQAIGVMPVADLNKDEVVDTLDVAILLQTYGIETDLYLGLWDGSRLLGVVGANVGFGLVGGIVPGNWTLGPGRRPSDDCGDPALLANVPPDIGDSMLPSLLRGDAARNCLPCPDYNDVPGCYYCHKDETVSGGSVSADPSQPLVGESVTFTATGVSEIAGQLICEDAPCGTDGKTEPTSIDEPWYFWDVNTKDANGWPEEWDPNDGASPPYSGPSITIAGGSACQEIRAVCWARATDCVSDRPWKRIGSQQVKFADFRLLIDFQASTPALPDRRKVGILEVMDIAAVSGDSTDFTSVSWVVETDGETPNEFVDSMFPLTAPPLLPGEEIQIRISATKNGCTREETLTVVPPQGLEITRRSQGRYHIQGHASAGEIVCVRILPDDVSFTGLDIGETEVAPTGIAGLFSRPPFGPNENHPRWVRAVLEDNKIPSDFDQFAGILPLLPGESFVESLFIWPIEWFYRANVTGTLEDHEFYSSPQYFSIDSAGTMCVTKFGISACSDLDDGTTPLPAAWPPAWPASVLSDCD